MKNLTALVTGVTGQDGSYLAEWLLKQGYRVVGMVPHRNRLHDDNIKHLGDRIEILYGDLSDADSLARVVRESNPQEIYNLGAQSFVARSWEMPQYTYEVTGLGAIRLMEAAFKHNPEVRFYQASTSEMFGPQNPPQGEDAPLEPSNPYAIAKLAAHLHARSLRRGLGRFVSCGILFNHESPRRPPHFVTQKIAKAAAMIKLGRQEKVGLGNLDAVRDWGFAGDYVQAMWLMLQQEQPGEFVVGTGVSHTVRDFCQAAFSHVGLSWEDHVYVDEQFYRPIDDSELRANLEQAATVLGWQPQVTFEQLVAAMVDHWLEGV